MKSELCKETGSDYDVFTTRSFYSNNIVIFFVIYFIHLGQTLEWPLRTTTDTLKNDLPIKNPKEYLTNYILPEWKPKCLHWRWLQKIIGTLSPLHRCHRL